ncbi:hypothetical protein C5167_001748 [Papaver somniferum]|uniref:Annexin n=1 Tax=Papaver somniferum TaxID=3469 RepID=A0A4Y7KW70_PAPSO|nr:annexin D3-like [Papaver somniferum]XP_026412643.1 annexin D3-like [Papaver somniferum]RZC77553.1 hypothetical protein C5167_001748 [Papaver somniferum]
MGSVRIPEVVPSPIQDSERLNKAFQGWGTDEKAVVWVLGHRNAEQRKKIRETYQQIYKESLLDRLKSELSGDFEYAVIQWMLDPAERDAKLIRKSLEGLKKKKSAKEFEVLVETTCAYSPHHLMAVRQCYCSLFHCSLEEDIFSNVSLPSLKKLLVSLVSSYRYDGELVDESMAKVEASLLRDAIENKQLDHDNMILVLSTRNVSHLKAIFQCYFQNYGNPIDQDIKNCGTSDLEVTLELVVQCIQAPEKHFAEVMHASMAGFGTDEESLSRAIVSRAEIDMMKVRGEYFNMYNTSLDNAVADDTSGDYKDFLMTLFGARI